MEAAEQDAAIRAGKGGDLTTLRFHGLRIAAFEAEDDQRRSRQVVALSAVLWRTLLGTWSGIAFLALAIPPAAATRPLGTGVGPLTARVGCSTRLRGPGCRLTATAATLGLLRRGSAQLRRMRCLGFAATRSVREPLQWHQCGQQPNKDFRWGSERIHEQPTAHLWQRWLSETVMCCIGRSRPQLDDK